MALDIVRWIREHDETRAVALARSLCMAEAWRHEISLSSVSITGRVKAPDQGIDGRTEFPPDLKSLFPLGPHVWQIKSGKTAPSADKEFNRDKHPGLIKAIADGADYVLFWTFDPNEVERASVETAFTNAAQGVRADANVTFLFATQIQMLCNQHLAVLGQGGAAPLNGLVRLKCEDGFTVPGEQAFSFHRDPANPSRLVGWDNTLGPSGACGKNAWLAIDMPFVLSRAS